VGRDQYERDSFRILFVCTGNICRSPFAEILTRHLLIGKLGGNGAAAFCVASAGVSAVVGSGMHPQTRAELAPLGLHTWPSEQFVARQLVPPIVEEADLVLTAQRHHRSAVAELAPAALSTTFTLREFARLLNTVDGRQLPTEVPVRARQLVQAARQQRGMVGPASRDHEHLPDPVGQPQSVHHLTAMLISEALRTFVDVLVPPLTPPRPRG